MESKQKTHAIRVANEVYIVYGDKKTLWQEFGSYAIAEQDMKERNSYIAKERKLGAPEEHLYKQLKDIADTEKTLR